MWFFSIFNSSQQLIWRMLVISSQPKIPNLDAPPAPQLEPRLARREVEASRENGGLPNANLPRGWHWGGTRVPLKSHEIRDPVQQKKPLKNAKLQKKNVFSWWSHLKSYPWKGPAQNPAWMTMKTLKAWSLADLAKSSMDGCLPGWDFSSVLVYRMGPLYNIHLFNSLLHPW